MVRVTTDQRSFGAGELSTLMNGRTDFARYRSGLLRCRNFITLPEGVVTRLPGTKFLGVVAASRIMAFKFRDEDAVLLQWSNELLRFWRQGALIDNGGTPLELGTPYSLAQAANLQSLQSSDVVYLVDGAQAPHRLSRIALTNWTLEPTPFVNGPFHDQNLNDDARITASAATGSITLTATADVFLAGHVGAPFQLRELDRRDAAQWAANKSITTGDRRYYDDRLYECVGFDNNTGTTGTFTPTFSSGILQQQSKGPLWNQLSDWDGVTEIEVWAENDPIQINDRRRIDDGGVFRVLEVAGFQVTNGNTGATPPVHDAGDRLSEDGGPVWRFIHDGSGVVQITAVTDARNASATVVSYVPDSIVDTGTSNWSEAAWSNVRGWPACIGGYAQRHIYAATPSDPRTIWASVLQGTVDMKQGVLADDGFSYTLEARRREAGKITYLLGAGLSLHVGSTAGETIGTPADGEIFGPSTALFDPVTSVGSTQHDPIDEAGFPLFIGKGGKQIYTVGGGGETAFAPVNLVNISRHILGPGATKMVRQRAPVDMIWCLLADGKLASLVYLPREQIIAWHLHELDGTVEDIEVMPSDDGLTEELYLLVQRSVSGALTRFLEVMQEPFVDLDGSDKALADAWLLECAVRWQGSSSTTITGLEHLNGAVVSAWTDKGAFANLTVTDGAVTLPQPVTSAIVGIDNSERGQLATLDFASGAPDGGGEGRHRAPRKSTLRFHQSVAAEGRVISEKGADQHASPWSDLIPPQVQVSGQLFNGVTEVDLERSNRPRVWMEMRPVGPSPMTVASLTLTMQMADS